MTYCIHPLVAKWMFWCPQPVPFALKEGVEKDLDRLQAAGIIEPIVFK